MKNSKLDNKKILYFSTDLNFPYHLNCLNFIYEYTFLITGKFCSKEKIKDLFIEYKLDKVLTKNPNKLSSGEKKKLIILLAEISQPELLILDEPDSNLDIFSRKFIYEKLIYFKKNGTTIIIATHIIESIENIIDYAFIIKDKKIVFNDFISKRNTLLEKVNSIYGRKFKEES
nr:AAA family ATPase [Mycoplasma crocodyli]